MAAWLFGGCQPRKVAVKVPDCRFDPVMSLRSPLLILRQQLPGPRDHARHLRWLGASGGRTVLHNGDGIQRRPELAFRQRQPDILD